jgi:Cdc6-like AAA superfamily ATPase
MSQKPERLRIARGRDVIALVPRMADRHGLIAGATGTGKTVALRVLAEQRRPFRAEGAGGAAKPYGLLL